ncbi:AraC family transcriptional regulator [Actinomycetospora sp. NBRC 106375]|uniref:GlxA family transcriptional regulator n=1 Tax=Actinomycetospora sp. NBRC 106375 TaxID=3032207 RepID=UPI0024A2111C|nr:helix-turn-helix domain-containing protein [Actinomycetospora sp. NBRC 106375]GLZ48167.1 AraC family transcriptional regulator [Actinomycetospora sp. NBRC 106375]
MDERLVLVVGFAGVELIDVACVTSAFDHANRQGARPPYRLVLATPDGGPVACDSGLALSAQERLDAVTGPVDTLVVSGGLGHEVAAADARLVGQVRRLAAPARRVASVCTGASVLAAAGLLDRRRATTHWHYADGIAARFPRVLLDPEPVYVRDGPVSTSGGVTAALDLTLALVEEDHGAELTRRVALGLLAYLHRAGDQAQRSIFTDVPRGDAASVRRVTDHVFGHLADDLEVTSLAALVNVSPRHLSRLFVAQTGRTPARYVRDARLEAAHQLVRASDCSLGSVARRCGFGSAETLRQAFVVRFGVTPSQLRDSLDTAVTAPAGQDRPG